MKALGTNPGMSHGVRKSTSSDSPAAGRSRMALANGVSMDIRHKIEKNQMLSFLMSNSMYSADSVLVVKEVTKVISKPLYVTVNKPYYTLMNTLNGEGIDIRGFYFIDASAGIPSGESRYKGETFEKLDPMNMTDMMLAIEKCLQTKRFDGMIFDSLSTLLTYRSEYMVLRFAHSLINKLREFGVRGIFLCIGDDPNASLMKNIDMFVDSSIDIERMGDRR